MKEVTNCDVVVDGKKYPIGTPIDKFDAGIVASLRQVRKISALGKAASTKADAEDLPDAPEIVTDDDPDGLTPGDVVVDDPDNAIAITHLQLPASTAKLMKAAGVTTLGEAREYFAEHGSFEPIKGIGPEKSDEAAELLGLK